MLNAWYVESQTNTSCVQPRQPTASLPLISRQVDEIDSLHLCASVAAKTTARRAAGTTHHQVYLSGS